MADFSTQCCKLSRLNVGLLSFGREFLSFGVKMQWLFHLEKKENNSQAEALVRLQSCEKYYNNKKVYSSILFSNTTNPSIGGLLICRGGQDVTMKLVTSTFSNQFAILQKLIVTNSSTELLFLDRMTFYRSVGLQLTGRKECFFACL